MGIARKTTVRYFVPKLERLEERVLMAAPVVYLAYPGVQYQNGYDKPAPGLYQPIAPLLTNYGGAGATGREVVLDPLTQAGLPSKSFKDTLAGEFPPGMWTFTYAATPPAGLEITVKTYMAVATTVNLLPNDPRKGKVFVASDGGAIIDFTTSGYAP